MNKDIHLSTLSTKTLTPPMKVSVLNDEIRQLAIELFALGYTVRTIRQQVIDRLNVELSENQLMQLAIAEAPNVEQARRELSKMALKAGLADKGIRVARLNVLAESWASRAEISEKAAGVYLRAIDQINKELEPLGLAALDPELDPWGKVLQELSKRRDQPKLVEGAADSGS
jgi:hypothetical protein